MRRRDISGKKYGISKEKYRELLYFCMQYNEMKKSLNYGLNSHACDGMPRASGISNPTEAQAIKNLKHCSEVKMIEDAAKQASEPLSEYILKSVTEGIGYEYMPVPAGRRQFYEARERFFYFLSLKR